MCLSHTCSLTFSLLLTADHSMVMAHSTRGCMVQEGNQIRLCLAISHSNIEPACQTCPLPTEWVLTGPSCLVLTCHYNVLQPGRCELPGSVQEVIHHAPEPMGVPLIKCPHPKFKLCMDHISVVAPLAKKLGNR